MIHVEFSELVGKTIVKITGDEEHLKIVCETGEVYFMYHEQDCCERVEIEDVNGDLDNLIGYPILLAEEVTQEGEEDEYGTQSWTFYKLANIKEHVTIRWLGESNGHYSVKVLFTKLEN